MAIYFIVLVMELRHLETFLAISELKSFTKAAEQLFLTQPTVSKQIVDLESFLGVRLLDRTKRSVELTRAGELVLQYVRDFVYLKKELLQAVASFKGLKSGTIRIGASTVPGIYILPPILAAFREKYSEIALTMAISDSRDIITRTEQGELDVGFVGARDKHRKVDYRRFMEDTITLVAPTGYPDVIGIDDLKKYPLIVREQGSGTRKSFDSAIRKLSPGNPVEFRIAAELTDTEAIKGLVRSGMGIAYVSRMAVSGELDRGTLKTIRVSGFSGIRRTFFLITRKGRTVLPQVKALIDLIDAQRPRAALKASRAGLLSNDPGKEVGRMD